MIDLDFLQAELRAIEVEYAGWKTRFEDLISRAQSNGVAPDQLAALLRLQDLFTQCSNEDAIIVLTLAYLHALEGDIITIEECVRRYGDPADELRLRSAIASVVGALARVRAMLPRLAELHKQVRQRGSQSL